MFAAIGMLITRLRLDRPQFILTFQIGFLPAGPLLAMDPYRIAQLDDRGEHTRLTACWGLLRDRLGSVALFTLLRSLMMIAWIRFSTIAAALYIGNIAGSSWFVATLATPKGFGCLLVLFGTGAVFAAMMFALIASSLPLVLDGRTDFGRAVLTSVRAVPRAAATHADLGSNRRRTDRVRDDHFFAAFVVIFPWLGYSTWAAYKDLFGEA
jgi:uncharacterized membrane protein